MSEETATTARAAAAGTDWPGLAAEGRAQRPGRIARAVEDCLGTDTARNDEQPEDRRLATAAALADIGPADEIETMLTTQLLTVHGLAMDCVRAARDPGREEKLRLAYLGHAGRLLSLYSRHVNRLEGRRDWSEARAQEAELKRRQVADRAAAERTAEDQREILDEYLAELAEQGEDVLGEQFASANGREPGDFAE
jgi:hypothetical protein